MFRGRGGPRAGGNQWIVWLEVGTAYVIHGCGPCAVHDDHTALGRQRSHVHPTGTTRGLSDRKCSKRAPVLRTVTLTAALQFHLSVIGDFLLLFCLGLC